MDAIRSLYGEAGALESEAFAEQESQSRSAETNSSRECGDRLRTRSSRSNRPAEMLRVSVLEDCRLSSVCCYLFFPGRTIVCTVNRGPSTVPVTVALLSMNFKI